MHGFFNWISWTKRNAFRKNCDMQFDNIVNNLYRFLAQFFFRNGFESEIKAEIHG